MKYSSKLISNVRALFGLGRVLCACLFVAIPILHFAFAERLPQDLGLVYFKTPALQVKGATAQTHPATIENLCAEVSVPPITDEDRGFLRKVGVLWPMVTFGLIFLFCQWMWQLCRNVERGDVFSSTNLKLVRRMGALVIVEALLAAAFNLWKLGAVAAYVRDRVSFAGLEVVASPADAFLFHPAALHIDLDQIVIGLVILGLTEVFRQGLQLKQEADLTV
ncbi:MAG: DUF2975 domain-containing protein [Verrucomicrobiota bacterium]